MSPPHSGLATQQVRSTLIRGAAWALAMRWSIRGMGLISTVILARILQPADYGVIAMAFLVVGLLEAFMNVGAPQALVRLGATTDDFINSAWTLRGLQGLLMAAGMALAAPWAAEFFEEPRLRLVLWVLAAAQAGMGFTNIGMTLAYRDLQFSTEFKWLFSNKVASVSITLLSALFIQDYRALLIGIVGGYVVEFTLSYWLHPFRPRWDTSRVKELWAVSKWLLFSGLGTYFLSRFDQLVAGKVGNTSQYGLYTVGADIGQLPTGEVGGTLARPLFPTLANLKHSWHDAERTALHMFNTINSVTLPLGVGLAVVSADATVVILGWKWTEAAPFLAGFALIGTIQSFHNPLTTLLNVAGHVKVQTYAVWLEFAVFAGLSFLLIPEHHLMGLVYARIASGLFKCQLVITATSWRSALTLRQIYGAVWPATLSAGLMALALWNLPLPWDTPVLRLSVKIAAGALVYVLSMLLIWHFTGRPSGPIRFALSRLRQFAPSR